MGEAFQKFVRSARELLARNDRKPAFLRFALEGQRLILGEAAAAAPRLRRAAELVRTWSSEHDLVAEIKMAGREDPTTELVRWVLSPNLHRESALARQHAWLRVLDWTEGLPAEPVEPVTQKRTRQGAIIDLVLDYPERAVVVEAKTGTDEHEAAQTGELQTVHYARAAREVLRGRGEPLVVYLTPDGRTPAGDAFPTTQAEVAIAVAAALQPYADRITTPTREAFRMALGHLLKWGAPIDLPGSLGLLERLTEADGGWTWTPDDLRKLTHVQDFLSRALRAMEAAT